MQPPSRYRLIGLVGQGQFGKVFCAYDRSNRSLIALKSINLHTIPTHKFLRELRCLVSLNHPGIVGWCGLEHRGNQRYLVMEYCEGGNLRQFLTMGKINLNLALKLTADILLGLEHAHNQGIIHCDLKPENILLTLKSGTWQARISDFGIARLVEENQDQEGLGDTGSPAYMAPERFYGQNSTASDLYAVGIILYELVHSKRPFSGTHQELMSSHLNQPIILEQNIPFSLNSLLKKALQKLPQHRFSSAREMLNSLEITREILAATSLPLSIPQQYYTDSQGLGSGFVVTTLCERILSLAGTTQWLYLGTNSRLICQSYDSSPVREPILINFQARITHLYWRYPSCWIITEQDHEHTIYQSVIRSDSSKLKKIFKINSPQWRQTIATEQRWLALAYLDPLPRLTLIVPRYGKFLTRLLPTLPSQLIAMDAHHGLAVFNQDHSTRFQLFTRRGNWFNGFAVSVNCQQLTPSKTIPYRLLGIEESRFGLLIDLKPLKISRFELKIVPDFIIPISGGYVLANRQGEINAISETGASLAYYRINQGEITAITSLEQNKLLLATWSGLGGYLSVINNLLKT